MHAILPNTAYKLVNIQVAVPAGLDDAEITDGLNDMLNDACQEDWIVDWQFPTGTQFFVAQSSEVPEEGELWDRELELA